MLQVLINVTMIKFCLCTQQRPKLKSKQIRESWVKASPTNFTADCSSAAQAQGIQTLLYNPKSSKREPPAQTLDLMHSFCCQVYLHCNAQAFGLCHFLSSFCFSFLGCWRRRCWDISFFPWLNFFFPASDLNTCFQDHIFLVSLPSRNFPLYSINCQGEIKPLSREALDRKPLENS